MGSLDYINITNYCFNFCDQGNRRPFIDQERLISQTPVLVLTNEILYFLNQ